MATLYISIILVCRVVQAIFSKRTSNEIKNIPTLITYTSFANAISAVLGLIVIIFAGKGFNCNTATVIIALFAGLTLFFSTFFSVYGMKTGTVSVNSMFGTAGMIVPLVAGIFLFNQPIKLMQWFGVALFFLSAWLLISDSKSTNHKFSIKTFFILIGSMVANGCTMLAQQLFTNYVPDGDVSVFSFISFGVIAVLGGISSLIIAAKNKNSETEKIEKFPKILVICAVVLAAAVFVINQLATLSTALVSPVILFSFINGGGTIISTIVAAIMYKEKLTLKKILGIVIGISSLVIIKSVQ